MIDLASVTARDAVDLSSSSSPLSDHLVDSLETLAQFHMAHYQNASALQRVLNRVTGIVGTPPAFLVLVGALAVGIGMVAFSKSGLLDPSFSALGSIASCAGLLASVLILVTQRHEDQLAERRGQLMLELAILADKRSAKIIALLEELRRDHPNVNNRHDPESQEMATPTDVETVLEAIEERAAAAISGQ
jgi:uncharacterized membrane protein